MAADWTNTRNSWEPWTCGNIPRRPQRMLEPSTCVYDDGGRAAAGYNGTTGDCVARAIAIAAQLPYAPVYESLRDNKRGQPKIKGKVGGKRDGINTRRKWFKEYMRALGWNWTPTTGIFTRCKVHMRAQELPKGRLIVATSRHYVAVIDGIIHDTHNSSDDGRRLVLGYWRKA